MQVFRSYTEVCQTIQTSTELYWYGEVDVAPTSLFFVTLKPTADVWRPYLRIKYAIMKKERV
jgi:hypothetical protein